ncbi:serine/threonine-protein kinase mos-like isoform X2 [Physella acuta]|uniref:serine/threonine-protein kinase mos-like isoform X2 n=1 Tax=Physella acuta TaxID=109671 RepID=UPI0027DC39FE|nr:serine/threonine-protein kinase mos-like isoform X2 [Physella acuta]
MNEMRGHHHEKPHPPLTLPLSPWGCHINISPPTPDNWHYRSSSDGSDTPNFLPHRRASSSLSPLTGKMTSHRPSMPMLSADVTRLTSRRSSGSTGPAQTSNLRRCDVIFGRVIGKGAFGKVHAGLMHGRPVAIKVVQKRRGSGIHREILQAERLAFSLNLQHPHLIEIVAVNMCEGLRGDALIVMELVSPRTLQSVLDDPTRTISFPERLRFATEMTSALVYLHDLDLVHLDVKPRNVLMTSDEKCKLADFGSLTLTSVSAPMEETEFTQLLGTLPYRAPELMKGFFPSNKADIYSLGISLWQLATRETPHIGANPHWLIYQVTKVNKRPDYHDTGSDSNELKYCDLYTACWDAEPSTRPSAEDVRVSLDNLLHLSWQVCMSNGRTD